MSKTVNLVANDSDPDGNVPLYLVSISSGGDSNIWGSVISSTSVTLGAAFAGTYALTYVVSDSLGATSTGTLMATVTGNSGCQEPPL